MALKRAFFLQGFDEKDSLSSLSANSSGELDILRHDGDSLGVNSAQVGIFEQTDQISFAGLLESHDGGALETEIGLEILRNFPDQTLERKLADQKFGGFLITTDFSQSDGSGPVTMRFLNTTGGGGALTSGLGCQLLSWGFASGTLSSGLLGSSHREMSVFSGRAQKCFRRSRRLYKTRAQRHW